MRNPESFDDIYTSQTREGLLVPGRSGFALRSGLKESGEELRRLLSMLADASKAMGILSLPIGMVLLSSYLGSENAPLPQAEGSLTILLTVVATWCLAQTAGSRAPLAST